MHIQHEESDIRGRHYINDESGNMLAEITYAVRHPDTMVVDHTEVSETLKGKNIGKELVSAVVEHAKLKGRHIIAACPFTRAVMQKTEGYRELLIDEPVEEKEEEKDKIYDPAGLNTSAPAPGMAAVNTFNSEEVEEPKESNKPK